MNQTVKEKELAKKMQKELAEVLGKLDIEKKELNKIEAKLHNLENDEDGYRSQTAALEEKKKIVLTEAALGNGKAEDLDKIRADVATIELRLADLQAIRGILLAAKEKTNERIAALGNEIAQIRARFWADLSAGLSEELRAAGRETIIKVIAIRNLTGQPWVMEDLLFRTFFPDGYHIAEFQNAAEGLNAIYG